MKTEKNGWVCQTNQNNRQFIANRSFAYTRSESIKKLIQYSDKNWRWWKRNYEYECVKAKNIIETQK